MAMQSDVTLEDMALEAKRACPDSQVRIDLYAREACYLHDRTRYSVNWTGSVCGGLPRARIPQC